MIPAGGSMLSRGAVAIGIFLLFTNLPVVMAERGMVPKALGVIVPACLGIAVAHHVVVRRRGIVLDRTIWLMLAFLAVFLLATFAAEGYSVALARTGTFIGEGIVLYFVVRNSIRTMPDLRLAMVVVVAAATLLGSLTVLQAVTGSYDKDFMGLAKRSLEHLEGTPAGTPADQMGLEDRARGPVDDPNRFAQILLLAAPLGFVLSLGARRHRTAATAGLATLVILGAVLLTYSRGAFLTLLVLASLTAPLGLVRPRRLLAVLVAVIVLTPVLIPGYTDRVRSIAGVADLFGRGEVQADGPTRGRTTEMLAALAAYADHPVIGVGPGQYLPFHSVHYQSLPEISIRELATPRRAHNLYLEIAAETGTLGLSIFMAIVLLTLRDLEALRRDLRRGRPDLARTAAGFALVLLAYLGTGMFLHLAFERYYWFILALTSAAVAILDRRASAGLRVAPGADTTASAHRRVEGVTPC